MSEEASAPAENLDQSPENEENVEESQESQGSDGGSEGSSGEDAMAKAAAEVLGEEDSDESEESDDSEEKAEKKLKEAVKKWKLKVGGKEIEIENEDELIKRAQMGYSADEKWQEAAQLRKQMDSFVQELQKNPGSALEKMGFDVDKLAEEHIARRIAEMEKSPEEIEREKLQREIQELRDKEKQREEEVRTREMQQMQEKYAIQIENEITDALDNAKSLPKSPYVVKRIADSLLLAMNKGMYDVTVADVLPIVEQDMKNELRDMFAAMPEELVEAVVGKDVLNKLRKRRVSKVKAPVKPKIEQTGESEIKKAQAEQSSKKDDKMSARDFFKNLGSY